MSTTRLLFNWLAAEMKKYAGYRPVCHHPHFSVHAWPSRLNWQWRHVVTPPPKLFTQVFHHSQFVCGLARQACPALSCQSKGNSYNCICLYWQHCFDVIEDLHENNGREVFSVEQNFWLNLWQVPILDHKGNVEVSSYSFLVSLFPLGRICVRVFEASRS